MQSRLEEHSPLTPEQTRSRKQSWLSWGSKGVLTLTDQGLIGGSNFLIGILLARQLMPAEYGAYALAFEIFMVLSLAYACLILEPMLVFGPSTYSDSFPGYFGTLLWLHLAVAFMTVILLGGFAWVVQVLGQSSYLPRALEGAMIAVPCVLLFWLARRAFYVKLDPKTAVIGGLLYCAVLLAGVFLFFKLRSLSPFVAFVLMAAGALAAGPMLLRRLKPSMAWRPKNPSVREVALKHWIYGRWALAAAIASWISGNIYYILLSSMHGLAQTGALRALLNFASPIGQVAAALFMLTLPYTARMQRQSGPRGVERLSWSLTPLFAGGAVAYWIAFLVFKHPILQFLYAGKYESVAYLLPYVAGGCVFRIATTVQIVSLKAMQMPFLSFVAWLSSDFVACFVGIPAIWAFGLLGALWAYVLSGAACFIAGFVLLRRTSRHSTGEQLASPLIEERPADPKALPSSISLG